MAADSFFYILSGFAFAFGAVIGSFLNVVAHRFPTGQSVVLPRSRCPSCKSPIRWYDNIPVVSWFVLDGQCRDCDAPISMRYALVELATGFLGFALWIKVAGPHFRTVGGEAIPGLPAPAPNVAALPWGSIGLAFGLYFFFLALLVLISLVDVDHYLIPHEFTLPGIVIGIVGVGLLNSSTVMAPESIVALWPPVTLTSSLIGAIGGGLAVVLLFYLYFAVRGIAGLGGGDVTMMALVGAWLGWPALVFVFFAASIQGLIAAGIGVVFGVDFLRNSSDILAEEDPREAARKAEAEKDGNLEVDDDSLSDESDESDDDSLSDEGDDEPLSDEGDESDDEPLSDESDDEPLSDEGDDEPLSDESNDELLSDESDSDDDSSSEGGLAVPFGPFIALAALEYFFIGEFLPDWLSLSYLYYGL